MLYSLCFVLLIFCLAFDFTLCHKVCYPRRNTLRKHIGTLCYSNEPPFDDMPLPQNIDYIAPSFHCVFMNATTHHVVSVRLPIADAALAIDPRSSGPKSAISTNVVIIVHGWTGSWQSTAKWRDPIVRNLLRIKPKIHIVFVEWSQGAAIHFGGHPYAQPAANTRAIGDALADFFIQSPSLMKPDSEFNFSKVHCIGFSLGAHVCAFAAKRMLREHKVRWGRLTALDPALVHFDKDDPTARLDKGDADFVDVIHTSRMGLKRSVGHIDFYPNGPSQHQPGCSSLVTRRNHLSNQKRIQRRDVWSSFLDAIESFAVEFISCSHIRSAHVFAESISNTCHMRSFCPCPSGAHWTLGQCPKPCYRLAAASIGYWSINDFLDGKRGNFYGETSGVRPYCPPL